MPQLPLTLGLDSFQEGWELPGGDTIAHRLVCVVKIFHQMNIL